MNNTNIVSAVRLSAVILFGLIIIGYGLFQGKKYIIGPVITIYSPQNGAAYNTPLIQVDGRVQNVSFLKLDGRQIFTDTKGRFSEKLLLSSGYNILVLDAQDKFGKTVSKKLELILKEY